MNAETDTPPDGEAATLCHDVTCVLIECCRDRVGDGIMRTDADAQALSQFAAVFARRLARAIGGRYIPKGSTKRAERDAAILAAFTGHNQEALRWQFGISRRLVYSITARKRRG